MGGEILGKEHKEKTGEQRIPQRRTGCGRLSCPSDSEVLEQKRVKARFVSLDPFASREDGTDEGKRGVVVKGLRSRRGLHWRREAKMVQEIHQR